MAKDCDFVADKDNQIRDAVLSRCNSEYMHKNWKSSGRDHFATMCKTKETSKQTIKRVESNEKNQEFAFVEREESNMEKITFSVGGVRLPMSVDSGATSNIVD